MPTRYRLRRAGSAATGRSRLGAAFALIPIVVGLMACSYECLGRGPLGVALKTSSSLHSLQPLAFEKETGHAAQHLRYTQLAWGPDRSTAIIDHALPTDVFSKFLHASHAYAGDAQFDGT